MDDAIVAFLQDFDSLVTILNISDSDGVKFLLQREILVSLVVIAGLAEIQDQIHSSKFKILYINFRVFKSKMIFDLLNVFVDRLYILIACFKFCLDALMESLLRN